MEVSYLETIAVGDLVFHDARHPSPTQDLLGARVLYDLISDELRDETSVLLGGEETGCEELRGKVAKERFVEYQRSGGSDQFAVWREREEVARICDDPTTEERFLLYAFSGDEPKGGVAIYNVQLVGQAGGVVTYIAMCGPMTLVREDSAAFMVRMLDDTVDGVDDNGVAFKVQIGGWKFPNFELRNRWNLDYPQNRQFTHGFEDVHDLVIEERDGMRFPVTYSRVAGGILP
jgi:hypothetical protein